MLLEKTSSVSSIYMFFISILQQQILFLEAISSTEIESLSKSNFILIFQKFDQYFQIIITLKYEFLISTGIEYEWFPK